MRLWNRLQSLLGEVCEKQNILEYAAGGGMEAFCGNGQV